MCAEKTENFLDCNVVLFSVPFEEAKALRKSIWSSFCNLGFGFMFSGTLHCILKVQELLTIAQKDSGFL